MSAKTLREYVAKLGRNNFAKHGFVQAGPFYFEKELEGLVQGVEFLLGTGSRKGSFTVNLYWRFTHNPMQKANAMDFWQRLGVFLAGVDEWYSFQDGELERTFSWLSDVFGEKVFPFFDRHNSIEAILRSYENREFDESMLFGVDAGWREFNIGYAYLYVGDHKKAREHLLSVVQDYSTAPYEWVHERRNTVEQTLDQISG